MTFASGVGTVSATTFTGHAGASFQLSQSFVQGAMVTTAPSVGAVSPLSDQVSTIGTAGNLTGTITTPGAMTVTN